MVSALDSRSGGPGSSTALCSYNLTFLTKKYRTINSSSRILVAPPLSYGDIFTHF